MERISNQHASRREGVYQQNLKNLAGKETMGSNKLYIQIIYQSCILFTTDSINIYHQNGLYEPLLNKK